MMYKMYIKNKYVEKWLFYNKCNLLKLIVIYTIFNLGLFLKNLIVEQDGSYFVCMDGGKDMDINSVDKKRKYTSESGNEVPKKQPKIEEPKIEDSKIEEKTSSNRESQMQNQVSPDKESSPEVTTPDYDPNYPPYLAKLKKTDPEAYRIEMARRNDIQELYHNDVITDREYRLSRDLGESVTDALARKRTRHWVFDHDSDEAEIPQIRDRNVQEYYTDSEKSLEVVAPPTGDGTSKKENLDSLLNFEFESSSLESDFLQVYKFEIPDIDFYLYILFIFLFIVSILVPIYLIYKLIVITFRMYKTKNI